MLCYITCVVLCYNMSHVMLCYMCPVMLYNLCSVMLCYITCALLCYITCVVLCYNMSHVMLYIPANSLALGVSLTPAGWKLQSPPAHASGPISHVWLKNVTCCRLAWHNFQKYVNSDPCKERKPYVKWINDNTFLAISDFVDKRFLDSHLRQTSDDFGNLRKWSCRVQKSQNSQDKSLMLITQKKLAGICSRTCLMSCYITFSCHVI